MGADRAAASTPQHIWTATLHRQGCYGGHYVGAQDRCALAGYARHPAKRVNLLETTEGLGGGRNMGCAVAGVHPEPRRAADLGLGRVLYRRQLCSGEKRGLCVGKTKHGKGTKWMVVADGQGLPVGGTFESASPAEVKLAPEAIFNASERLGRWPNRLIADKAYDADWLRSILELAAPLLADAAFLHMTADGPAQALGQVGLVGGGEEKRAVVGFAGKLRADFGEVFVDPCQRPLADGMRRSFFPLPWRTMRVPRSNFLFEGTGSFMPPPRARSPGSPPAKRNGSKPSPTISRRASSRWGAELIAGSGGISPTLIPAALIRQRPCHTTLSAPSPFREP